MDALLQARGVEKSYGSGEAIVHAVTGVDLSLAAGESVAVMGPSGCGKSTLLHLLGGLDRPSGGAIWLCGHRIDGMGERGLAVLRRRAVGFVFQAFHLIDELSAIENVELPMLLAGCSPRFARRRAVDLLSRMGLDARGSNLPSELSGGQRQRVAIARAISNEPEVLFADEPTGNLDSTATTEILRLFEQLRRDGQAILLVTHDPRVGATADRLISMQDGAFVEETRLDRESPSTLAQLTGLDS